MMHIITGSARGTRLFTLQGDNTRPTAERTKEAVFSMLPLDLSHRRVLDLFAGSGQMALEALSRGAARAVLVDRERAAIDVIRRNAEKTHLADRATVVCADSLSYLARCGEQAFHLVFLDPPYASGLLPRALEQLLSHGLLTPGATVVAECPRQEALFGGDEALSARFEILKQKRYGAAHVFFLTPALAGGRYSIGQEDCECTP